MSTDMPSRDDSGPKEGVPLEKHIRIIFMKTELAEQQYLTNKLHPFRIIMDGMIRRAGPKQSLNDFLGVSVKFKTADSRGSSPIG